MKLRPKPEFKIKGLNSILDFEHNSDTFILPFNCWIKDYYYYYDNERDNQSDQRIRQNNHSKSIKTSTFFNMATWLRRYLKRILEFLPNALVSSS